MRVKFLKWEFWIESREIEQFITIGAFLVGIILLIDGITAPPNDKNALAYVVLGAITLSTDLLASFILSAKTELNRIVYISNQEENWYHAIDMLHNISSKTNAFDISCIRNDKEFEKIFLNNCKKDNEGLSCFRRLIAAPSHGNSKTADWINEILDPSIDSENKYENFRSAILGDNVTLLHYPHVTYTDFLIIEHASGKSSNGKVVIGFQKNFGHPSYNTGLYSTDYEIVKDFRELFVHNLEKDAIDHLYAVKNNTVNCEICERYSCKADYSSLLPCPSITSVSPNTGPTIGGTTINLIGIGFTGATSVTIGTLPATSFTIDSDTQITAISPAGNDGYVYITVTTPRGTSRSSVSTSFIYEIPSTTS